MIQSTGETSETQIIMVGGQPGIGKSHILARIRKIGEQDRKFLFVQVRPIADYQRLFLHIYQETFISLRRKWSDFEYTPLELMMSNIISDAILSLLKKKEQEGAKFSKNINFLINLIKENPLDLYEHFKRRGKMLKNLETQILEYLFEKDPKIDITFWEVLLKTLDPNIKMNAFRWLQGDDLSEDDLKKLNISSSITDQTQAQKILATVFSLSPLPILLSFDQLESLYDRTGDEHVFRAFFDILVTIHGHVRNCVILLLIQSSVWNHLESLIQKSAVDRIQENITLVTPTPDQLVEMVEKRMELSWKECEEVPPYKSFPFPRDFINEVSKKTGYNPRSVLQNLGSLLDEMRIQKKIKEFIIEDLSIEESKITDHDIREFLLTKINDFILYFSKNQESYPARSIESFLRDILEDVFKSVPYMLEVDKKPEIQKIIRGKLSTDLDLTIKYLIPENQKISLGIQVSNTDNGRSFFSVVDKIHKQLTRKGIHQWLIVRNEDMEIKSTWTKTNELLYEIQPKGKIIFLDFVSIAKLMVSKELLDSASAGDLSVGKKTISRGEVLNYLANEIFLREEGIRKLIESVCDLRGEVLDDILVHEEIKHKKEKPEDVIKPQIIDMLNSNPLLASKKIAQIIKVDHTKILETLNQMVEEEDISIVQHIHDEIYVMKKAEDVF